MRSGVFQLDNSEIIAPDKFWVVHEQGIHISAVFFPQSFQRREAFQDTMESLTAHRSNPVIQWLAVASANVTALGVRREASPP